MRLRFLQDYQGQWTGPHFYRAGEVYDLDDATARLLVGDGRAVEVVPPVRPDPTPAQPKRRKGGGDGVL
jgi:hypothetical protein